MSTGPDYSAVYYSHGLAPLATRQYCAAILKQAVEATNGEIIAVTWHPLADSGLETLATKRIVWPEHIAMHENLYRQILAGLELATSDIIFLVEHDVLYPIDYFKFMAELCLANTTKLIYNQNVYYHDNNGYFKSQHDYNLLSNLCVRRKTLIHYLLRKIAEIIKTGDVAITEPGTNADIIKANAPTPTIDIRHTQNFTGVRESDSPYLSTLPYWGNFSRWTTMNLRIFVLSHRQDLLNAVLEQPHLTKVNLNSLQLGKFNHNLLAEGRAFLTDLNDSNAEYIGLANARWDDKYKDLKIRLETLGAYATHNLRPDVVLAAWTTLPDWLQQTLQCHPTMADLMNELSTFTKLPFNGSTTFWANDFICHREVWYKFRQFWRRCFSHFHGRYGYLLPYRSAGMDVSRMPAFFYERVTTLYFANRKDLRVIQIP